MTEALPDIPIAYEPDDLMQVGFLSTPAHIAVYGGIAGSAKTATALIAAGQHTDLAGYGAVLFRRHYPELFGSESVWSQAHKFYPYLDGTAVRTPHPVWTFPSGATIEFQGLQHPGDETKHQGKRYHCVVFEEATKFTKEMFWFLFGRVDDLKDKAGNTVLVGHMRATCNPDADSFMRELVDWWIDERGFAIEARAGVLRWFIRNTHDDKIDWFESQGEAEAEAARRTAADKAADPRAPTQRAWSFTFFPGRPSPRMGRDYHSRLGTMTMVERERMQKGNWNIRAEAGTVFKREWFPVVSELPAPAMKTVRGWDKGAVAKGDASEGAKVISLGNKGWVIAGFASCRGTPGERKHKMKVAAESDEADVVQALWQDPGGAGVYDALQTQQDLRAGDKPRHSTIEPATKSKMVYAETWSSLAFAGFEGRGPKVYVMRGPWNEDFFSEADAFDGSEGGIDNKIDAVSRAFLELLKSTDADTFVPSKDQRPKRTFMG